jgi:hypothetical protein
MVSKQPVSEERNAVKNRSGPATVTGDERSKLSLPLVACFGHKL